MAGRELEVCLRGVSCPYGWISPSFEASVCLVMEQELDKVTVSLVPAIAAVNVAFE